MGNCCMLIMKKPRKMTKDVQNSVLLKESDVLSQIEHSFWVRILMFLSVRGWLPAVLRVKILKTADAAPIEKKVRMVNYSYEQGVVQVPYVYVWQKGRRSGRFPLYALIIVLMVVVPVFFLFGGESTTSMEEVSTVPEFDQEEGLQIFNEMFELKGSEFVVPISEKESFFQSLTPELKVAFNEGRLSIDPDGSSYRVIEKEGVQNGVYIVRLASSEEVSKRRPPVPVEIE